MSLVKGFTDILTPVNRWVDSAFTRGGGYDSTLTFSTIASNTLTRISETVVLYLYNNSLTNVTVTRTTNLITITATVASVGTQSSLGSIAFLNQEKVLRKTNQITIGAELVSNSDITLPLYGTYRGTTTVVYRKPATKPGEMSVTVLEGEATDPAIVYELAPSDVGKTISFSFMNPFVYEGSYCNPPYKESLDCSPSNPYKYLMYLNDSIKYAVQRTVNKTSNTLWQRLLCIRRNNQLYGFSMTCNLNTSGGNVGSSVVFRLTIIENTVNAKISVLDNVKPSTGTSYQALQKLRVARDNNNNYFLEVYKIGHTGVNNYWLSYILLSGYNTITTDNYYGTLALINKNFSDTTDLSTLGTNDGLVGNEASITW